MGPTTKNTVVRITVLIALLLCFTGCGRQEEAGAQREKLTEEISENVGDGAQETAGPTGEVSGNDTAGKASSEMENTVREIPVDFSFWSDAVQEEVDCFSLTLAQLAEPAGAYELRLYDRKGDILQRVACGALVEPEISFGDFNRYPDFPADDIEIFSSDGSGGVYIGWRGDKLRFGEAIKIPRYTEVRDYKMLLIEEGDVWQERKIYQLGGEEEVRRSLLNKDTGELEIWDCMDGQTLFQGIVLLDEEKNPVNRKYYDFLLWEDIYSKNESKGEQPVSIYLDEPREADGEHSVQYESREALLADFGFEDREPMYQCYDWHHDLLLELYRDEKTDRFCGIAYDGYYINTEGEKEAFLYGFVQDGATSAKWEGADPYSEMTSFKADEQDYVKDYKEFIDYTPEGKPDHFRSQGKIVTQVEVGEVEVTVMEIDYVYRDDGTLFFRDYGHSTNIFATNDSYLYSFYDEKGRVLYERGYVTHGHLEDYYIYEGDGDMPAYHLELDYAHGYAFPYLEKYD